MTDDFEDRLRSSLRVLASSAVPDARPVPPPKTRAPQARRPPWLMPGLTAAAVIAALVITSLVRAAGQPRVAMPTMSDGCVSGWPSYSAVPPVSNTWYPSSDVMLPAEAPIGATVCIYTDPVVPIPGDPHSTGFIQPPRVRLEKSRVLSVENAGLLARTINSIDPMAEVASSCPPGYPAFTIIAVHYPGSQTAVLLFQSSACQELSNGKSKRYEVANPSFYEQFATIASKLGLA